jgi:protein ImuA
MAGHAVAQEMVYSLRETIARLEGKPVHAMAARDPITRGEQDPKHKLMPTGIDILDDALDGGIALDALTEIRTEAFRDAGAASGFVLALATLMQAGADTKNTREKPFLWITDRLAGAEVGVPYPLGLNQFGLDISRFFKASPRRLEEALWIAETALASGIFCVTILEVKGNPKHFGLSESRRLSLRAKAAGRPLLLLRHAGQEEASSAAFRFLLQPAAASQRRLPDGSMLGGSIGHSVVRLTLEKSRNPASLSLFIEWNPHDRQFTRVEPSEHAILPSHSAAHSGAQLSTSGDGQDIAPPLGALLAFDRAS